MFFREDDALVRLFLDDARKQQLDRLWATLRWVSQEPLVEEKNYPQFLGFVSQDGPGPLKNFKTRTEEGVHQRAAAFTKDREAAAPKHLVALLDFASRAYRRPLLDKEKTDLRHLYDALRKKEMTHEDAFRLVLTRVLMSPTFLYRIEQPSAGKGPQPVLPWEQATRLSYFLWATTPSVTSASTPTASPWRNTTRSAGCATKTWAAGPSTARPGCATGRNFTASKGCAAICWTSARTISYGISAPNC
jgi:hypothetical protein